jgi:drug/metabolite transporter (DMT)-like permease
VSDFLGGVLTRRANAWAVAVTSQGAATVLTIGLAALDPQNVPAAIVFWAALAGAGSGAGNVLIYRGLAAGRMTIVAPVSALAAAALPVLVGLGTGERPGLLPLSGVLIAIPAIWLVAGGRLSRSGGRVSDVLNGLAAGLGFGVQFSALGQIPLGAGLTPLAISQVVSVCAIVVAATATTLSVRWVPRDRFGALGAVAGLFAGVATICFQLAVQSGLLTVAAVLTSLYPVATVLLAATVLRERVQGAQGVGFTLAAIAVALIASG